MSETMINAAASKDTAVEKTGAVLYADAGARPNPGFGGFGIHGYVYDLKNPYKVNGMGGIVTTSHGYVTKDVTVQGDTNPDSAAEKIVGGVPLAVNVKHYIDAFQSVPPMVTNNAVEVAAVAHALEHASKLDEDLIHIHVLTDSKYTKEGAEYNMHNWANNNWLKADGNPVANVENWIALKRNYDGLSDKGIKVTFDWVKGHSGNTGNEEADFLATMGVFGSRKVHGAGSAVDAESPKVYLHTPAEGYWKRSADRHPMIAHKRCYFNTLQETRVPGRYYLGNHGKDDDLLGKRISDASFSVVHLDEHDGLLEKIQTMQAAYSGNADSLYIMYLDQLYTPETNHRLNTYGEHSLEPPSGYRLDLRYVDGSPITRELKPAMLALRAVDELTHLDQLLIKFTNNDPLLVTTDITDSIYEIAQKVIKGKKGTPDKVETTTKLRAEIVVGCSQLKADVNYKFGDTPGVIELTLATGIDILDRNALKRLETLNPKVHVITWEVGDQVFRYATVIIADGCRGIYAGAYSNVRIVPKS